MRIYVQLDIPSPVVEAGIPSYFLITKQPLVTSSVVYRIQLDATLVPSPFVEMCASHSTTLPRTPQVL
nr:MAG TPA: hypothetical protein [Bacteriophage sp.]